MGWQEDLRERVPAIRARRAREGTRMEITMIGVDKIDPSPFQTRRFTRSGEGLEELASSIEAVGVLEPVLVRPNGADSRWELLAGERRVRACELAGIDQVPAIVRKLDDDAAMEVTVTENLQRKELHPLDEAEAIELMLQRHEGDVDEVAARLGRPRSFVARRARLTTLTEVWREALEPREPIPADADTSEWTCRECGSAADDVYAERGGWVAPELCYACDERLDLSGWGVTNLEIVARLAQEDQDAFFDEALPRWNVDSISAARLEEMVDTWLRKLSSAPWKCSDPELLPEAGACTDCQLRASVNPGLFDGVSDGKGIPAGDRCLSRSCWGRKLAAHIEDQAASLKEATGKTPKKVTTRYDRRGDGVVHDDYYLETSDAPKEGHEPAVRIDGPEAGQVVYVRRREDDPRSHSSGPEKGPMTMEEKRERLRRRRYKRAIEIAHEALEEAESVPGDAQLLILAATVGTSHRHQHEPGGGWYGGYAWQHNDEIDKPDTNVAELVKAPDRSRARCRRLLWQWQLRPVIVQRTKYTPRLDIDEAWAELEAVAQLVGVDVQPLMEQAVEELPEPKSWAS